MIGFAVLAAAGAAALQPATSATSATGLQPVPCSYELTPAIRPRVTCYRLKVLRRYDAPERGTYDLAVAIRRSAERVQGKEPVLWLHGGPGGGITAGALNTEHPFLPGADVVYLASRGARSSEPQPCDDLEPKKIEAFVGKLPWEERVRRYSAPFLECRSRLAALGIRTDEFGTHLNTEDIERLRVALGIRQWNIWSGSYGTGSAYDLIARYPRTVRAAVLISPIAPVDRPGVNSPDYEVSLRVLGGYCRSDARCNARIPDLASAVAAARREVAEHPIILKPFGGLAPSGELHLDSDLFDYVVAQTMGSAPSMVKIPRLVLAARSRDVGALDELVRPILEGAARASIFGRASFHCVDRPQYHYDQSMRPGGRIVQMIGVCPQWARVGPPIRIPRDTGVPVLLMPGELDNNTHPHHGEAARRLLGKRAQNLVFPAQSHMPYVHDACAREIAHAFLERPQEKVKAGCLKAVKLAFELP
jgi:pimeloyl-ACP methyl ester carboxylesterase